MSHNIQVLGISNAIVDVFAHVDEQFLVQIGAPKRSMVLIDEARAREVYGRMGPTTQESGGSVANTIAGIANLGGRTAYIGCVADDQLGQIFNHDMQSLGVDVRLPAAQGGLPTARSYILITPDGERTMQTYLGACTQLSPKDVTARTFGEPEVALLEGYVWDLPQGPAAIASAIALARQAGTKVAMSLSDAECVKRHHAEFTAAVGRDVTIVFGNETEVMALFEVSDVDAALRKAAQLDALFVVTRSEKGSVIVQGSRRIEQAAYPVRKVVDATGAGDAYVAGFLYSLTSGRDLKDCADLGSRAATAVIQQVGARLEKDSLYRS
ncbi:MAG TPA: adenosine kinase [Steroidobacteraceae bacterium]|nr:adenosine kinase [Steroidobacteraceae bacterium]